jgi:hypothetical protein
MNREVELVKQLGDHIGYGQLMCIASALWRKTLKDNYPGTEDGAFIPALFDDLKDEEDIQRIHKEDIVFYDQLVFEANTKREPILKPR